MRHCPHCGREIEQGNNFCIYCGTKVREKSSSLGAKLVKVTGVIVALLGVLILVGAGCLFTKSTNIGATWYHNEGEGAAFGIHPDTYEVVSLSEADIVFKIGYHTFGFYHELFPNCDDSLSEAVWEAGSAVFFVVMVGLSTLLVGIQLFRYPGDEEEGNKKAEGKRAPKRPIESSSGSQNRGG